MKEELPANHAKERQKNQKNRLVDDLIFKEEAYAIMGACFQLYKEKGCGFLEPVYQECMEIELNHRKISARPKPSLLLTYRGITLRQGVHAMILFSAFSRVWRAHNN